jgi:hypothetical protein
MRIIDNIAPTSEPFHVTIQIFSFPELFAMQGDLDCKLDPKLCAIVSGKWILHVYLTVQYEEDDAEGKRERGLRRKDRKCIKETHRVMVEMGITCVAEEGWWEWRNQKNFEVTSKKHHTSATRGRVLDLSLADTRLWFKIGYSVCIFNTKNYHPHDLRATI